MAAAAPKPTMPGTFNVPARRPRSWPPPTICGSSSILDARRTYNAPTPFGPYNLCALNEARSTSRAATSRGTWPAACTASVWNQTPRARHAWARSATGCSTPISLFAVITEASTVSGRNAAANRATSTRPSRSTGTRVTAQPSRSRLAHTSSTALCSVVTVTRCPPCLRRAATAPRMASMLASVAPLVKTISWARALMSCATC